MSRKQLLFLLVALVSRLALAQGLGDQVNAVSDARKAMVRASDQVDKAQISRSDGIRITAVFMETQAARNALKQTLTDYVQSAKNLQENHATRLTKMLTQSEGQLRIIHAAERLSKALGKIDAIASEFSLIAPDASTLANQYSSNQNAPVARQAEEITLLPPTEEQAQELLKRLQNNDQAFEAAYSAFCERMQKKFGYSFIEEATKAALRG
jgi:hypothetical protein